MNENEHQRRQFWVVWNPNRGLPTVTHKMMSEAREEARRLAEKYPTEEFFVLASLCTVCAPKPIALEVFHG